jgi:hypothetical protein
MAFGKKNKNSIVGVEKSEVAKKYSIRISTPNGYFPEDADKIIIDLENQIQRLDKENQKLLQQYESTSADLNAIKTEYSLLQMEMMKMNINVSDYQSYRGMEQLVNINPDVGNLSEVAPEFKEKNEIPVIDIIEDSGKTTLDEMITPVNQISNEDNISTSSPSVSVFNEDGSLDII